MVARTRAPLAGALVALALLTPVASAGAPGRALTQDRNGDGRIDRIAVVLPRASAGRTAVAVAGYRVLRVARSGRSVVAALRPHARPDAAARPRVRVRVGKRTYALRARDGVRPRLTAAHLSGARLVLTFSEPLARPERRALTLRAADGRRWTADAARHTATTLAANPASAPVAVTLRRAAVRDRAGNAATVQTKAIARPAATKVAGPTTTGTASAKGRKTTTTAPATTATTPTTTATTTATTTTAATTTTVTTPSNTTAAPGSTVTSGPWHVLTNPIDPRQQTDLAFGDRSHWLQPWRGYLDTPPVSALRDAAGINFNVPVDNADLAAKLLADAGIARARLEEGWSELSYDDPTQLADPTGFRTKLLALKSHGIRPLILLNANDSYPTPVKRLTLTVLSAAAAGARSVKLDAASAAQVVPGRTGLSDVSKGRAAQVLITAVAPDGTATLAEPLPAGVPAGARPAATLRYEPFGAPKLADGTASPRFEATMSGWLQYVDTVTRTAKAILGGEGFDVEVWNEMNFGSDFLDAGKYYAPVPAGLSGTGSVPDQLLRRTVAYLRDPVHGVSHIGITDGFASQTPWISGATEVPGLTAMSKHPYYGRRTFANFDGGPNRPLNAQGGVDGWDFGGGKWLSYWCPNYTSYFPEYYLSGIQTETLIRDLSPITTKIGSTPHGRTTAPAGGTPPQTWITETNINATEANLPAADRWHMQAKSTLRTLAAYVNKGVSALYFYAVLGTDYGMVDLDTLVKSGGTDPGATLDAMGRMYAHLGSGTIATRRALSLRSIADQADRVQFRGDGTAAHPDLHDRDVVGAFPFQVSDHRFVVPAYVMTRDVAHLYDPSKPTSDPTRYDLPPEAYRLELGGVDGQTATVSAYDPLSDTTVKADVVARGTDSVTVQLDLTDSPRLLQIQD